MPIDLLTPLLRKISGIDEVYLFVSSEKPIESILKEIGFKVERYSFVKRRLISSSLETPRGNRFHI
ncbi:GCN5-related N-acetyltransferase (fragment) [Mesotoga infera]